jgi:prepilin-type N-terminal cleavage/methylation domain-containing protein
MSLCKAGGHPLQYIKLSEVAAKRGFWMNRYLPRRQRYKGFTLIELLVVIGIIVLLLGILLPVISKVRTASYTADTQQELSQLSTAINQYYGIFHAYPGPLTNDQIEGNTPLNPAVSPPSSTVELYQNGTYSSTNAPFNTATTWNTWSNNTFSSTTNITSSENLVLGLLGGLRIDPATGVIAFAPSEVGLGPLSLNPANPRRYSALIDTKNLMWCSQSSPGMYSLSNQMPTTPVNFHDQATNSGLDSPIPEIVDRYPNPMPILYLRARVGAQGVVSDGIITNPNTNAVAAYQYDLRDIFGYVGNTTLNSATPLSLGLPAGKYHNISAIETTIPTGTTWPPVQATVAGVNSTPDAFSYFANFGYTPTNESTLQYTNYTARPRTVDQFILISAGPDGIYGTQDDVTSFGNVAQ